MAFSGIYVTCYGHACPTQTPRYASGRALVRPACFTKVCLGALYSSVTFTVELFFLAVRQIFRYNTYIRFLLKIGYVGA